MEVESILRERGVRITPNRILVAKSLMRAEHPMNLGDLEGVLYPMDRTSIFRVLELFTEKDIVHVIDDGSRSFKYELCSSTHHHIPEDQHVHFHCEKCGETFCLSDVNVPLVGLPDGFIAKGVNYVVKGECPK